MLHLFNAQFILPWMESPEIVHGHQNENVGWHLTGAQQVKGKEKGNLEPRHQRNAYSHYKLPRLSTSDLGFIEHLGKAPLPITSIKLISSP